LGRERKNEKKKIKRKERRIQPKFIIKKVGKGGVKYMSNILFFIKYLQLHALNHVVKIKDCL